MFTNIKDYFEWAGYLFSAIGFLATVYKAIEVWVNLARLSWKEVDKYSMRIIKKIRLDAFSPDVIVTIGRGGAIVGAIISGNLNTNEKSHHNISLVGVDRFYQWSNHERNEIDNPMVDYKPLENMKVLLVAGDVMTGETMKFTLHKICEVNISEVRTACLVKSKSAIFQPDYWGKIITSDFSMPWMYKGQGYIRDSRRSEPPKKRKLWHVFTKRKDKKGKDKSAS